VKGSLPDNSGSEMTCNELIILGLVTIPFAKLSLIRSIREECRPICSHIVQDGKCQNIHLVPKLFDMYRVRCITGGALLVRPICYRIAENPPPNLSISTSDIFAGYSFNKVFCWLAASRILICWFYTAF
jgi:hypothetical protein